MILGVAKEKRKFPLLSMVELVHATIKYGLAPLERGGNMRFP